ncbi:MAG: DMT family transporter [Rhodobacteraceae bacterium]|nr:DMT family transporter [Paracoccaceae bacterium]
MKDSLKMPSASACASAAPSPNAERPVIGILFLLTATTIFPLQDVIIKMLSNTYAVHQVVFLRSAFALPFALIFARLEGPVWPLKIGSWPLQLLRAGAAFTSYMFYYMALAAIGLAETAAITFTTPMFVTLLAVPFLGERVGLFRWFAVCLGLAGVTIIVQPGRTVFEPAAVLALLAAVFYATSIIATRKLGHRTNGGTMTVITILFYLAGGASLGLVFSYLDVSSPHPSFEFLFRGWSTPDPRDWLLLIAIGATSAIGFFSLSQAYRVAEASIVTPFEYTYMPWAVLWGWVFFNALPTATTWVGLLMIIGAGLLILFREAARGRRLVRRRGLGFLRQR